jgi:long-chain-fatty-acyl-CoA reductase
MNKNTIIELPIVVGGRLLRCSDLAEYHTIDYESGLSIRIPAIDESHLEQLRATRTESIAELSQLTIHDITTFLSKVGMKWMDPEYPIRKAAELNASRVTGFSRNMLAQDYRFMGGFMRNRTYVYDYFEWELGSERMMDEWSRNKASWVRAFPKGIVLHSMVGNMVLANAFSVIWGVITKNINLAKVPARDPVTPLALAESFVETDPDHPITRALTAVYWKRESPLVDYACQMADVVLAWGGNTGIKRLKEKVPAGVSFIEFGPKWSLSVVDLDRCDANVAAWRMASDVTFYDQEACLSPQRLFVKGDVDSFISRLAYYLDKAARFYPKECVNPDALAHFSMTRLEANYRGWNLTRGAAWSIIEVDDPTQVADHPLGRTLFVHRVKEIDEVTRYLNYSAQTLCCEPLVLGAEYRDCWAVAGVDRIVELGMSRWPQYGYTHDGTRPLTDLVRWVSVEAGVRDLYRYYDHTPEDVEDFLFPWREENLMDIDHFHEDSGRQDNPQEQSDNLV